MLPSAVTESIWHLFGSRARRRAFSSLEVGPAAEKWRLGCYALLPWSGGKNGLVRCPGNLVEEMPLGWRGKSQALPL